MLLLFVFIDVIAILLSVLSATATGERYGSEFSPDVLVLLTTFLLTRSILFWVLFRSVIRRDIDWTRSIIQSIFLITFLSVFAFTITALPSHLISSDSEIGKNILFFAEVQGVVFYFVVIPILMAILSIIIHKLYKFEPW